MENKIDYRFKIIYAVAIIMVVCGHCNGGGVSFFMNDWFPYGGLHLSLFAFCSGYFYKRESEEHIGKYILKKLKMLILPMYIYTVVYGLVVQLLRLKGFTMGADFNLENVLIAPITNGHQFIYNMGGWFVVPLFMIEVYNVICRKVVCQICKSTPEIAFFLLNLLLGIAGNVLVCRGHSHGWWLVIVRMLYFLPFYSLGTFYRNNLEKHDRVPSFLYLVILFSIRLVIILAYGRNLSYTPSWCNNLTEGPIMPIVIGYLGIALWMRIATLLEPVIGRSKWINLIADNTYSIMMNQFIGIMIVKTIYGILSKYVETFGDFDWTKYKSDIGWYYVPGGINQSLIIYVIAGIAIPIIMQKAINLIKGKLSHSRLT